MNNDLETVVKEMMKDESFRETLRMHKKINEIFKPIPTTPKQHFQSKQRRKGRGQW